MTFVEKIERMVSRRKGGSGSGNFGHEGRPGEVGGSGSEGDGRMVFHGTLSSRLPSILQEGIKSGRYQNWKVSGRNKVFSSSKRETAEGFGLAVALNNHEDHFVVLKIAVPKNIKIEQEFPEEPELQESTGSHIIKGAVPKEWIQDVFRFRITKRTEPVAYEQEFEKILKKETGLILFIPFPIGWEKKRNFSAKVAAVDDPEAGEGHVSTLNSSEPVVTFAEKIERMVTRRKGGPGSGNFGHSGRPGEVGGSADGEGGGEDTRRPVMRVGITAKRPERSDERVREIMQSFSSDLNKTPAKNVSISEGRGAWNGDHEPTWVTSYDGNGEAMRTCVKYGAETEQDSVLFMRQSSEDDPKALPVSYLSLSDEVNVDAAFVEEIEAELVKADVGYWTWTRDEAGKPVIMTAAVRVFGHTRESHATSINTFKSLAGSKIITGTRVEWRRNEFVWNPAKAPEGELVYDDVLIRGASPFDDGKKGLTRTGPDRITKKKEDGICRSTTPPQIASSPPRSRDGCSRKDSRGPSPTCENERPTERLVPPPSSSRKTIPPGRTSWSPPGSPSRKNPSRLSSSISDPDANTGHVPPLDKDEREFRKAVQQQFRAQTAQVHSRVEQGHKAAAVDVDTKKWDRDMVEAVRPTWYGVFKRSGDAALKRVRRKDGSAVQFMSLKAQPRPGSIVIPEWVEDPNVLRAIEREMFKFAHEINQTTADLLREELLDGMELGETIAQLSDRIAGLSDEWVEGWRSEMIARTETTRATTVGNIEAWRSTGVVERKVWLPAGDACPFCLAMDGIAVGLDENFLDEGDTQEVEWREQDIQMTQGYGDVKGPPLHPNCRCVLVAELSPAGEKMLAQKGGAGSGNFGHSGRPGLVGGSGEGGSAVYDEEAKRWTTADGKGLPEHIAAIRIPPAWTDVQYNPDPDGELLVRGKDAKGRIQSVYSEAHWSESARVKFARTREVLDKWDKIQEENARNAKDPDKHEEADCVSLIMATGIRPGSDKDTGAEKQAYGATTLRAEHVVEDEDGLHLRFVGKKGVDLDIPVRDEAVAKMVRARVAESKDGRLFKTDARKLLDYTHTLDGGKMKTKDFRTAVGTKTARDEMNRIKSPSTEKEYKRAVRQVAQTVSARLGNTPTVALQSYIDPLVFAKWRNPSWGGKGKS